MYLNWKERTREDKEYLEKFLQGFGYVSSLYTLSSSSKGRQKFEAPDKYRTCFERDRDRIIYSDASRRLRNKTQVFLLPNEQHLTTRMTHTEEVYQVARSICSELGLNEVLAEAIARGHDIGHTPFGHTGEGVLTDIMRELLGDKSYKFHHAKYGLEVVSRKEPLNLTKEVLDGIEKHSGGSSGANKSSWAFTAEGRVVARSDKIAYVCSDVDDALSVGLFDLKEIKPYVPWSAFRELGSNKSEWVGNLIKCVVESTIASGDIDFKGIKKDAFDEVLGFMYGHVYGKGPIRKEFDKARIMMRLVFEHVMENQFSDLDQTKAAYETLDVVACMTDISIVNYFNRNFLPKGVY